MAGWLTELKAQVGNDHPVVIHVVGTKSDIVAVEPSRRKVPFERTIAYVAEQLYPTQASTPPPTAGFGSLITTPSGVQSPDSKRSSAFWGQDIGWDCCHEISAKDGEGVEEVFRVIARKLVEQRNKQVVDASQSARHNEPSAAQQALHDQSRMDGYGSFRVGYGDKRRSWLGFPQHLVAAANGDEDESPRAVASKKRPCC
jgi:hypothetical protein